MRNAFIVPAIVLTLRERATYEVSGRLGSLVGHTADCFNFSYIAVRVSASATDAAVGR